MPRTGPVEEAEMPTAIVVGAQWGDEAKGKITDILAQGASMVVRYAGGSNAGHSVTSDQGLFKLHLVPSGILNPRIDCIISDGVVVDPAILVQEIDELEKRAVSTARLYVSASSHVVMPYHRTLDRVDEEKRGGRKIGTTCQGVGPAYTDKVRRIGIRMGDFTDPKAFPHALHESLTFNNLLLQKVYDSEPMDEAQILQEYTALGRRLKPFVRDTAWMVGEALAADRRVLFEGAQGTLLDIDHGTYPYVTSSHPVAGGACLGTGAGPTSIDAVIGIVKAYTSRVGAGNFPTELLDEIGAGIRERGNEYGTTTGRARRIGWLDAVALRFAMMVNGIDRLAITLLDVLSGVDEIRVCKAYRLPNGKVTERLPLRNEDLAGCEPLYETFKGWTRDISKVRRYADLPAEAREYVEGISRLTQVPVWLVSVGPHRQQTVLTGQAREGLWLRELPTAGAPALSVA